MGRSRTFTPNDSAKLSVTGIEPPSRVRSGSRLYTACEQCVVSIRGHSSSTQAHLSCTNGGFVVPVLVVSEPGTTVVEVLDLELVLRVELRELLFDVRLHKWFNSLGSLWGHDPDRTCKSKPMAEIPSRRVQVAHRIENLPETLAGMTVFAPGP